MTYRDHHQILDPIFARATYAAYATFYISISELILHNNFFVYLIDSSSDSIPDANNFALRNNVVCILRAR